MLMGTKHHIKTTSSPQLSLKFNRKTPDFYSLKILYGIRELLFEYVKKLLSDLLILSSFKYRDVVYEPGLPQHTKNRIPHVQNGCICSRLSLQ